MEDASKALLIGAGVLIGILILTLATRFYKSASSVTQTYYDQESESEIATFNSNFTRFIGTNQKDDGTQQHYATIYDIISLANFAWDYNSKAVEDPIHETDRDRILHINLKLLPKDDHLNFTIFDLQNLKTSSYYQLIQNCYYKTNTKITSNIMNFEITDVQYMPNGRINEVTFSAQEDYGFDIETQITSMKTSGVFAEPKS